MRAVVRLPIVALAVFTAGVFPFEAGLVVTKAMIPAASITGRTKPHMYRRRGDFACAGAGFDFRFGGAGTAATGTAGPAGVAGAGDGGDKSAAYADAGAEGAVAAQGSLGPGDGTETSACAGVGAGSGIGSAMSPEYPSGDAVGVGIGAHKRAVYAGEDAWDTPDNGRGAVGTTAAVGVGIGVRRRASCSGIGIEAGAGPVAGAAIVNTSGAGGDIWSKLGEDGRDSGGYHLPSPASSHSSARWMSLIGSAFPAPQLPCATATKTRPPPNCGERSLVHHLASMGRRTISDDFSSAAPSVLQAVTQ